MRRSRNSTLKRNGIVLLSCASLVSIAVGVSLAVRSPLFLVQVVEIGDRPESAPVSAQEISDLAAIPLGKVNLFDLNLNAVEKRVLTHPWIRRVNLVKRFPQTLSINVVFRDPQALLQHREGDLSYIDADGVVFGRVNVLARSNLPLISGIQQEDTEHLRQALRLLDTWEKSELKGISRVSSLSWEKERGFRAWVVYPMQESRSRTQIHLGVDTSSSEVDSQFHRLGSVIQYLSQHSIAANQIWADSGKKIVVRTAHGS